jgi:hypothetical protein
MRSVGRLCLGISTRETTLVRETTKEKMWIRGSRIRKTSCIPGMVLETWRRPE